MYTDPIATFVTTTSHGSWLPGDARGYIEQGIFLPTQPKLEQFAKEQMQMPVVIFSPTEQETLFTALVEAAKEFEYQLTDAVAESTHLHWIAAHRDEVAVMVGRLKNRMRQRLGRGRIWTKGYCHRLLFTDDDLQTAREYHAKHDGVRMLAGRIVAQPPGKAGG